MSRQLLFLGVAVCVLVCGSSVLAAAPASMPVVHFARDGGSQSLTVPANSEFNLTFTGNPTTGFWWFTSMNFDSSIVKCPTKPTFVQDPPPYNFYFTCQALQPGTDRVDFICHQAWAHGPPAHTANLTVTVQAPAADDDDTFARTNLRQ